MSTNNIKSRKIYLHIGIPKPLIFCFILAVFFVFLFSYSTSPLYPYYFDGDSAQFLTIGKAWYLGKIPYKDMFDHKGPIIYFVDMIGFLLTHGNKSGVCAIQIVFMCFTLYGIYKISQFVKCSSLYGAIAIICSLIAIKANYVVGNTCEEYCIPFICWSMYGILQYFYYNRFKEHSLKWSFLYGVTMGVCFFTRVTNFAPLCAGIFAICIILVIKKNIRNLCLNAMSFLMGCLAIILPFSLYFIFQGCFKECLYATFFYNIEYVSGNASWIISADSAALISFAYTYFVFYIIFAVAIMNLLKKDYLLAIIYTFTGLIETYLFMSGNAYSQYPLTCFFQLVLFLNETMALQGFLKDQREEMAFLNYVSFFVLTSFISNIFINNMLPAKDMYTSFHTYTERAWESLLANIPQDEYDSFVAYGDNEFKGLYLLDDLMPCYKYFSIQQWHTSFSEKTKNDIYETYASCTAKWILSNGLNSPIEDILSNSYFVYATKDNYTLYRLLEK